MSPEILQSKPYGYSVDFYTLGVLLYEILTGLPPHYSENKLQMYKNISGKPVKVNKRQFTPELADLLEKLLIIDPEKRIGFKNGAQEIKDHPFFADFDWEHLVSKERKIKPPLDVEITRSNFDEEYTSMGIDIDVNAEYKDHSAKHVPKKRGSSQKARKRALSFPINIQHIEKRPVRIKKEGKIQPEEIKARDRQDSFFDQAAIYQQKKSKG